MGYNVDVQGNWIHFTKGDCVYSFHFLIDSHFFFIDDFKENGRRSFLETNLKEDALFRLECETFFQTMFEYAKKIGCFAIFTDLISTLSFILYDFKENVKLKRIQDESQWQLAKIVSSFNRRKSYFYHEFNDGFVSDIVSSYVIFHYHFLRELKSEVELLDFNEHTKELYYEGYKTRFFYAIKKEGLYVSDPSIEGEIKIIRDNEQLKEQFQPVFQKMKKKGRIKVLFESEFYFAKLFFQKYFINVLRDNLYLSVMEKLQSYYSKREIELVFWRTLHCYSDEISLIHGNTFPKETFRFLELYFTLNGRSGEIDVFESKKDYLLANE